MVVWPRMLQIQEHGDSLSVCKSLHVSGAFPGRQHVPALGGSLENYKHADVKTTTYLPVHCRIQGMRFYHLILGGPPMLVGSFLFRQPHEEHLLRSSADTFLDSTAPFDKTSSFYRDFGSLLAGTDCSGNEVVKLLESRRSHTITTHMPGTLNFFTIIIFCCLLFPHFFFFFFIFFFSFDNGPKDRQQRKEGHRGPTLCCDWGVRCGPSSRQWPESKRRGKRRET
jgi:hypothetical protein